MADPTSDPIPKERVILLHGLGETSLRMQALELALRAHAYDVTNPSYPSTAFPAEQLAEDYIAPLLTRHRETRVHFITHSLGGVLLRYCLERHPPKQIGRIVMMTPGHHGSEVFEIYRRHPLFSATYGPVAHQSGTGEHCFPCGLKDSIHYELGIIAGCLPLDPFSLFLAQWPHDGRISVSSTRLKGMKDHITIPAPHELITFHPLAIYQALHFLKQGEFHHLMRQRHKRPFAYARAA